VCVVQRTVQSSCKHTLLIYIQGEFSEVRYFLIMPSEPIEAEFAVPPALSLAQEEEFRQLEQEGPLHSSDTLANGKSHGKSHKKSSSLEDEEAAYTKEGIKIVAFESGTGEDPREWSKFRKWYT
jgi:hypothetical protein